MTSQHPLPARLEGVSATDLPPLGWTHATPFEVARVDPIRNFVSVSGKPRGGLWLSPLLAGAADGTGHESGSARTAWEAWAASVMDAGPAAHAYEVRVKSQARIVRIDSHADYQAVAATFAAPAGANPFGGLPMPPGPPGAFMKSMMGERIDYEALAASVDLLWFTEAGIADSRHGQMGASLWDVETVLVLRAEAIETVRPLG